jgi:hypothetical protein
MRPARVRSPLRTSAIKDPNLLCAQNCARGQNPIAALRWTCLCSSSFVTVAVMSRYARLMQHTFSSPPLEEWFGRSQSHFEETWVLPTDVGDPEYPDFPFVSLTTSTKQG